MGRAPEPFMNQRKAKAERRNSTSRGGFFLGLGAGLAIAGAIACGTTGKENLAKTALNSMPASERHDTFEATARLLDDRPDLVDELYATTKQHPKMLDRFLADASADLADKDMAEMVTRHLTEHPDSVEMMMKVSIVAIHKSPPSRAAMNRAVVAQANLLTDILTDDPNATASTVSSMLVTMEKKPAAQKNVLLAVEKDRAKILAFAKNNPKLSKEIAEQVIREEVKDKPAAEKMLRAAKIIDDDGAKDATKKSEEPKKVENPEDKKKKSP